MTHPSGQLLCDQHQADMRKSLLLTVLKLMHNDYHVKYCDDILLGLSKDYKGSGNMTLKKRLYNGSASDYKGAVEIAEECGCIADDIPEIRFCGGIEIPYW